MNTDPEYRALVCREFGDWRDLELTTLGRAELSAGQVRIRVRHVGIGFALKLFVAGTYQRRPALPFTPGTEISGEVLEVGDGVDGLTVGQRVVAALDWGGLAEEVVTTADTVYPLPDGADPGPAAALPITYPTVWSALAWRARLEPGETVLVHGAAGAVGTAAVQISRLMGARVIATASTPEKRAAVAAEGADAVLPSTPDTLREAVRDLTRGRGADVVIDPVGGALFDESVRSTAPGGRLVTLGFASGSVPRAAANHLLVKDIAVIGHNYGRYIGWGRIDERREHAPAVRRMVDTILAAYARGDRIRPRTDHLPLEDWEKALEIQLSGRATGKMVVDL
ncbi:NADPH:quinone oxidoreductase family protein [Nocardioides insulae]|uniref:NADPH:quinone oxidoreductase family protein n=1 Tax=Nocardioides insulae TaxID=394734 RepID=UPI000418C250|nr:NADPH:quinone oxidoreductase family protein [Nocardioides insulae]